MVPVWKDRCQNFSVIFYDCFFAYFFLSFSLEEQVKERDVEINNLQEAIEMCQDAIFDMEIPS